MATNYIILENYNEAQNYKLNSFNDIVIFKCSELKMLYIKKYLYIDLNIAHLSEDNSILDDLTINYSLGIPELYKYPKKVSGLQSSIYNKLIKPYAEYRHYNAITNIRERNYQLYPSYNTSYNKEDTTMISILQPLLNTLFPDESFNEEYNIYLDVIGKKVTYIMHRDLLSSFPLNELISNVHIAKEKLNNLTPSLSGYDFLSLYFDIRYNTYGIYNKNL